MGRYFPLFGEEWGVYFFARKSPVSGATVARIVDGIRDGRVVQDALARRRLARDDFSGLREPPIASPRRTSKSRSVSQRDGLPLARRRRREAPSSNGEIRAMRIFISLFLYFALGELRRCSFCRVIPGRKYRESRGLYLRLGNSFSNRASVFADIAFPPVWRV